MQRMMGGKAWMPWVVVGAFVLTFHTLLLHLNCPNKQLVYTRMHRSTIMPTTALQRSYFDYRGIYQVYTAHHYATCPEDLVESPQGECWLPLQKPVHCKELFNKYLHTLQTHKPIFPAPSSVPQDQLPEFTLSHNVAVKPFYLNEPSYAPDAEVPVWNLSTVDELVASAKGGAPALGAYDTEVQGMYRALQCHSIQGLQGAVFGSADPWLESVLLAYGAAGLMTIEYRKTLSTVPSITVITPEAWAQGWLNQTISEVDFAASFSSFEHDGLGRYGDPMNAWGDVESMARVSCYVKHGGLMFLAVPTCGIDTLQFNAHRVYGPMRWPLLASNWQVLGVFSGRWSLGANCSSGCAAFWPTLNSTCQPSSRYDIQPVVVLRNKRSTACKHK